jgi:hypothetical protein
MGKTTRMSLAAMVAGLGMLTSGTAHAGTTRKPAAVYLRAQRPVIRRALMLITAAVLIAGTGLTTPARAATPLTGRFSVTLIVSSPSPATADTASAPAVNAFCVPKFLHYNRTQICWGDAFFLNVFDPFGTLIGKVNYKMTQSIQLSAMSRDFTEHITVTDVKFSGQAPTDFQMNFQVSCAKPCHAANHFPQGSLLAPGTTGIISYHDAIGAGKVQNASSFYSLVLTAPGFTPSSPVQWRTPIFYRCDDALAGQPAGCVIGGYPPTLTTLAALPDIANSIRTIQGNGPGHYGWMYIPPGPSLPNGGKNPLHRLISAAQQAKNYNAVCGPKVRGKAPKGMSCAEYPFQSTYEGGTTLDALDRGWAWVLAAQQTRQNELIIEFYDQNRLLDHEQFWVSVPPFEYVAMGDSYSAGEGNPPYYPGSDTKTSTCHRSRHAFATMITLPGQPAPVGDNFWFIACSGTVTTGITADAAFARSADEEKWNKAGNTVWEKPQVPEAKLQAVQPQLGRGTRLVTLSVGGNDARFADVLTGCLVLAKLQHKHCSDPKYTLRRGILPGAPKDPMPLKEFEPKVILLLRAHLERTYLAIHEKVRNAEIIVAGYPDLFPVLATSSCTVGAPAGIPVTLSAADQNWLNNDIGTLLNAAIHVAVMYVRDLGVNIRFVDPTSTFAGHTVCSKDPWIYGLRGFYKGPGFPKIVNPASFHPNRAGQQAYARLINACLAGSVPC